MDKFKGYTGNINGNLDGYPVGNIGKVIFSVNKDLLKELFKKSNINNKDMDNISIIIEDIMNKMNISDNKYKKRLYSILVEILENFHKHADILNDDKNKTDFSIIERNGFNIIEVISHTESSNLTKLKNIINNTEWKEGDPEETRGMTLNDMSIDQLKNIHKKRIDKNIISPKGGAGLGMIEIARAIRNMNPESKEPIFDIRVLGGVNGHANIKLSIIFPVCSQKIDNITDETKNNITKNIETVPSKIN